MRCRTICETKKGERNEIYKYNPCGDAKVIKHKRLREAINTWILFLWERKLSYKYLHHYIFQKIYNTHRIYDIIVVDT